MNFFTFGKLNIGFYQIDSLLTDLSHPCFHSRLLRNISHDKSRYMKMFKAGDCNYSYILGAAEWTPTFLEVTGKGLVGVGRHGRWQQFRWIV